MILSISEVEKLAGFQQRFHIDPERVARFTPDTNVLYDYVREGFAKNVSDFAWGSARLGAVHIDPRDVMIVEVSTPSRWEVEYRMVWNPMAGFDTGSGLMSAILVDHEVNHFAINKSGWRTGITFARIRPFEGALMVKDDEPIPELVPHELVDFTLYGWNDITREWVMTPDGKAPERPLPNLR